MRTLLRRPYMATGLPKIDLSGCVFYAPLWRPDLGGSTFYDLAGHNLCTVTGAVWGSQGRTYNGDDLINIDAALTPLASTTTGTWLTWINSSDVTPAAQYSLICFGNTAAASLELIILDITTGGKVQGQCYLTNNAQWSFSSNSTLSDNTWYQIGITHNGTTPALVINGVVVASTFVNETDKTRWFSALTGLDNGRLGCGNYGGSGNGSFLTGTQGVAVLYSRVLSASELMNRYLEEKWRY